MKQLCWLVLFICSTQAVTAQRLKVEREYRTFPDLVPEEAREWMSETYSQVKKVKWYYEEDEDDDESYEAKFKLNGLRYSVAFDDDGDIEDVEIERSWKRLSPEIKKGLQAAFSGIERFKLKKIQEQWTAEDDKDLKEAARSQNPENVLIRYEVEFRARIDGIEARWEGLFDTSGLLLSKRLIYPPFR